jgi:hypothetical protein
MARARERLEIDDAKKDPFDVLATRARRDDDAMARTPPNISRPEQSPLLGKLATFLPSLASANEALATKTASEVNIEVASDGDGGARIEMVRGDEGERAETRVYSNTQTNERTNERTTDSTRARGWNAGFGTRGGGFENRRRGARGGETRGGGARGDASRGQGGDARGADETERRRGFKEREALEEDDRGIVMCVSVEKS